MSAGGTPEPPRSPSAGPPLAHPAYGRLRPVTAEASVLLARNPSPMTLEGTNSWVLRAPGERACVVVDPGPDDPVHLAALREAGPVTAIVLTHGHPDHADGARHLHELTGAPVRALDPRHRFGGEGLHGGDVVAAAGVELRVVATPGHTGDSLCFAVGRAILTGDTVLGRGSTVVAHPDGRLADYLASLRRLSRLGPLRALPGHGPELADVAVAARGYLEHRMRRLEQVRRAVATLGADADVAAIVAHVYAEVDPALWPAARLSLLAQLEYLADEDPDGEDPAGEDPAGGGGPATAGPAG